MNRKRDWESFFYHEDPPKGFLGKVLWWTVYVPSLTFMVVVLILELGKDFFKGGDAR